VPGQNRGAGPRTAIPGLLLATLPAVVLSKAVWNGLAFLAAVRWPGPSPQFADLSSLAHRPDLLFGVVLEVLSIKLTGQPLSPYEFVIGVVRFSTLVLLALALFRVFVQFRSRNLYMQVLAAIIVINLAENLFSASASTARYVLPSVIFGIPLVSQIVCESRVF
jgi:hypothetical protein